MSKGDEEPAFHLLWDHAKGMVQVRLPSGTRINFDKASETFLWAFCNEATMLHKRDPQALRVPISEAQLREMKRKYFAGGGVVIKPLVAPPSDLDLEDLGI